MLLLLSQYLFRCGGFTSMRLPWVISHVVQLGRCWRAGFQASLSSVLPPAGEQPAVVCPRFSSGLCKGYIRILRSGGERLQLRRFCLYEEIGMIHRSPKRNIAGRPISPKSAEGSPHPSQQEGTAPQPHPNPQGGDKYMAIICQIMALTLLFMQYCNHI